MTETAIDTAAELYGAIGKLIRVIRQESGGLPLGPGAAGVMVTLSRYRDGLRLGALADIEGVRKPSLTRIVASLEEDGLVERTPDPDDGRAQLVALTERGADLIAGSQDSRLGALRTRIEGLSAQQRKHLEAALPALAELASREER